MNGPAIIILAIACVGVILFCMLAFEVATFLMACSLSRVPSPGITRGFGIVLVLLVIPGIFDAIFGGLLYEAYRFADYPLWEAGLVQFFLALPMHMGLCSVIHSKMMGLKLNQGLAVWIVEKLLKLGVVLVIAGVVGLYLLIGQL